MVRKINSKFTDKHGIKTQRRRDIKKISPFEILEADSEINTKIKDVEDFEKKSGGNEDHQSYIGDMYLDIAFRSNDYNQRLELHEKAVKCWENSLSLNKNTCDYIKHSSGHSLMQKAFEDVYKWQLLDPETPPSKKVVGESYEKLLNTAEKSIVALNHYSSDYENGANETARMLGNIAEIDTLLIAQRHGLLVHTDNSWLAVPSLRSQDVVNNRFSEFRSAWDVSIFTYLEETPTLTYKIQVKAHKNVAGGEGRPYEPDISVINVANDLSLNSQMPIGLISAECYREFYKIPDYNDSENLDERTGLFLDILG